MKSTLKLNPSTRALTRVFSVFALAFTLFGGSMATTQAATFNEAVAAAAHTPNREQLFSFDYQGHDIRFRLDRYTNRYGQFQVDVYFLEDRFFFDTEKLVLHGRDLDGDLYPETWFVREDEFITSVIHLDPSQSAQISPDFYRDGEDAIVYLAKSVISLKKDSLFKKVYLNVVNFASRMFGLNTVPHALEAKAEYANNELDLLTLQLKIDQMKEHTPPGQAFSKEIMTLQGLVSHGRSKNLENLEKVFGKDYFKSVGRDVTLVAVFVGVAKLLNFGFSWAARYIGTIPAVVSATATFEEFYASTAISRMSQRMSQRWAARAAARRLEVLALEEQTERVTLMTIYKLRYQATMKAVQTSIEGLAARHRLANHVLTGLKSAQTVYHAGLVEEFRYLTMTQSLQVLAEAHDRWDTIYDPNPIVLTKNLLTNKEFIQDFAFMTHESMLQSGVHSGTGPRYKKFAVAGVVSFVDSGLMNFVVKGNVDRNRIIVDTGWEMTVGNAQTMADVTAIQAFRRIAETNGNPKLKLVGYVIAAVDQFVGYSLYASQGDKMKKWLDKKSEAKKEEKTIPTIKIIPILAPDSTLP